MFDQKTRFSLLTLRQCFPLPLFSTALSHLLCSAVVFSFISITEDESCFLSQVLLFQGLSGWGAARRLSCWWLSKQQIPDGAQRDAAEEGTSWRWWSGGLGPTGSEKPLQKLAADVCRNAATSVFLSLLIFSKISDVKFAAWWPCCLLCRCIRKLSFKTILKPFPSWNTVQDFTCNRDNIRFNDTFKNKILQHQWRLRFRQKEQSKQETKGRDASWRRWRKKQQPWLVVRTRNWRRASCVPDSRDVHVEVEDWTT